MVILKNKNLVAHICEVGAELKSLSKNGENYLWCGDPSVWGNTAPMLFPICGSLREDKYILNGERYTLPKHGFARDTEFSVESQTESTAVFLHTSNSKTKKMYPFDYELRVIYKLNKNSLKVTYKVSNRGAEKMYFSIGSHEAYATDGFENYDIVFPKKERLDTVLLEGPLVSEKTETVLKNGYTLPLLEKYFSLDTLIFKNLKSKKLTLRNRKTEKEIKVDFKGFPYLLLWHKPGAEFICIEPWCGLPDYYKSDFDITKKAGIKKLSPAENFKVSHKITL